MTMKRTDFLKTCAVGACGCGVLGLLSQAEARAERPAGQTAAEADETAQLKFQLDGARERFALLYGVLGEELDDAARDRVLRKLGGACSKKLAPLLEKYKGDLKGFLALVQTAWLERAELDEKAGTLRVIGKPAPCACPLVKPGRTPASFCRCTLGWQEAVFSTLTGKPVTAEIVETVLGGGSRCSFLIRFL
jgi:predicted hydrocarbon binding protein